MPPVHPLRVFVCYAHEDTEPHRDLLMAHLKILELAGFIIVYYDGLLDAGKPWDLPIKEHLRQADIVILLMSPGFYRSRYIQEVELREAIKRNEQGACALIPVLVEPCFYQADERLARLQILPLTHKRKVKAVSRWPIPNSAWGQVTKVVHEKVQKITSGREPLLETEAPTSVTTSDKTPTIEEQRTAPLVATDAPPFSPPQDLSVLPLPEYFIGRKKVLDAILASLTQSQTPRVIAVTGMPGIGKTALLAQVLRNSDVTGEFPGGTVVVSCRHQADAVAIVKRVLARFDPDRQEPKKSDWAALAIIAQQMLGRDRCLVVLDDIESSVDLEPILRCLRTEKSFVLLAAPSRQSCALADDVHELTLLRSDEAERLLAQSIGGAVPASAMSQDAMERSIVALASHPLAIRLAGRRAAVESQSLDLLADQVARDPLQLPTEDADAVLDDYLRARIEELPDSARLLCIALASFAGPDIGKKACIAAGTIADILHPEEDLRALLDRAFLEPVSMKVESPNADSQRVRMHPRIAVAARRLYEDLASDLRSTLEQGIAAFYIDYVSRVSHRALTADLGNIAVALKYVRRWQRHDLVIGLCSAMSPFWLDRWMTTEAYDYLTWGMDSAQLLVDASEAVQRQVATVEIAYGRTLRRAGDLRRAEEVFIHNRDRWRTLGDLPGQADVLDQLAQIARAKGQMDVAKQYCDEGLSICAAIQDNRRKAILLAQLGRIERSRGNLPAATDYFAQSLTIFRDLHDAQNIGVALGYLGRIARTRGRISDAERYFKDSYNMALALQDRRGQAVVLSQRGRIARTEGRLAAAQDLFNRSLQIAREVWDRQAQGVDLGYLGRIERLRGKLLEAEEHFRVSLRIAQEIEDHQNIAVALGYLGRIARSRGDLALSNDYFLQSLTIARDEIHDRRSEGIILDQSGQNATLEGDLLKAQDLLNEALVFLREAEDRRGQALVQMHLGWLHLKQPSLAPSRWLSESFLMTSLAIAEEIDDRRTTSLAQRWLGVLAEGRNDLDLAERYFKRSVGNAERGGNLLDLIEVRTEFGRFLVDRRSQHTEGCSQLEEAHRQLATCTGLLTTAPSRVYLDSVLRETGCQ